MVSTMAGIVSPIKRLMNTGDGTGLARTVSAALSREASPPGKDYWQLYAAVPRTNSQLSVKEQSLQEGLSLAVNPNDPRLQTLDQVAGMLHQKLLSAHAADGTPLHDGGGGVAMVVVNGPAGAGKTQATLSYVARYRNSDDEGRPIVMQPGAPLQPRSDHVDTMTSYAFTFWLRGSTLKSFRHDMRALAVALGAHDRVRELSSSNLEIFIPATLAMLPNFLLVVDSFDLIDIHPNDNVKMKQAFDLLASMVTPRGDQLHQLEQTKSTGHVILTTRFDEKVMEAHFGHPASEEGSRQTVTLDLDFGAEDKRVVVIGAGDGFASYVVPGSELWPTEWLEHAPPAKASMNPLSFLCGLVAGGRADDDGHQQGILPLLNANGELVCCNAVLQNELPTWIVLLGEIASPTARALFQAVFRRAPSEVKQRVLAKEQVVLAQREVTRQVNSGKCDDTHMAKVQDELEGARKEQQQCDFGATWSALTEQEVELRRNVQGGSLEAKQHIDDQQRIEETRRVLVANHTHQFGEHLVVCALEDGRLQISELLPGAQAGRTVCDSCDVLLVGQGSPADVRTFEREMGCPMAVYTEVNDAHTEFSLHQRFLSKKSESKECLGLREANRGIFRASRDNRTLVCDFAAWFERKDGPDASASKWAQPASPDGNHHNIPLIYPEVMRSPGVNGGGDKEQPLPPLGPFVQTGRSARRVHPAGSPARSVGKQAYRDLYHADLFISESVV